MKLESAATKGKDVLNLTPELDGNTIKTTSLVYEIFRERDKHSVADLACYAARALRFILLFVEERSWKE